VLATQNTLNTLGNTLANECTKRKHMQNELVKLKIQIQQKEEETVILKENVLKIKNKSMTTEERLNELNKIYEVNNIRMILRNVFINDCSFYIVDSKSNGGKTCV